MPQWECLPDTHVGLISDKLKSLVWQHKPAIPSGGDIGGRNNWIPGAYLVKFQAIKTPCLKRKWDCAEVVL